MNYVVARTLKWIRIKIKFQQAVHLSQRLKNISVMSDKMWANSKTKINHVQVKCP